MASADFLAAHFSYGLNLDQAGLLRRAPDSVPLGSARLPDHRLAFDGVATICPEPGRSAWGYLWALSPGALDCLDDLEGYPALYDRKRVDVETSDGDTVPAFAYFLVDPDSASPYGGYLPTIEDAYTDLDLPLDELHRAVSESHGHTVGADTGALSEISSAPSNVVSIFKNRP